MRQTKPFSYERREKFLARQLGWPRHSRGFRGAFASLLNPLGSYKRPRSYLTIVQQQNRSRDLAMLRRLEASAEKLNLPK
jgi:hypothetical protein